jgi:branched-chain amino acid transport system ATP-binding protein
MSDSTRPLITEKLTMHFGGLAALEDIDLVVERGTIHAIIGPNGAGKSTFFNCLTGLLRPTSGRVLLEGRDVTGLPPERISQLGVARSYQITNIFPGSTCLENIRVAVQSRHPASSFLRHHRADTATLEGAASIIDTIGLGGKEDVSASNLSHGEQRNLEIGIALATEPTLLCLDEPTAGMSASETRDIVELIRRIGASLTILIVEHDMQVVMSLAQRITVLDYGQVLAQGSPEEIQANPQVQEAYLKI